MNLMAATFAALAKPRLDETQVIPAEVHDLARRCQAKRERERAAEDRASIAAELVSDLADMVRVLRTRDGSNVTDAQADERARNMVTHLLSAFRVERWP
ncbi:MAG TPA: hypothetical protein VMS92_22925 [Mycobacterium sp.]|nr:hypothetical protein [Mycobacterium sp.]